jgi:hypothetical protein
MHVVVEVAWEYLAHRAYCVRCGFSLVDMSADVVTTFFIAEPSSRYAHSNV